MNPEELPSGGAPALPTSQPSRVDHEQIGPFRVAPRRIDTLDLSLRIDRPQDDSNRHRDLDRRRGLDHLWGEAAVHVEGRLKLSDRLAIDVGQDEADLRIAKAG